MYAEITHEAFRALVPVDSPVNEVEKLEHGHKEHYFLYGVRLMAVTNYIGAGPQYYIEDINS